MSDADFILDNLALDWVVHCLLFVIIIIIVIVSDADFIYLGKSTHDISSQNPGIDKIGGDFDEWKRIAAPPEPTKNWMCKR